MYQEKKFEKILKNEIFGLIKKKRLKLHLFLHFSGHSELVEKMETASTMTSNGSEAAIAGAGDTDTCLQLALEGEKLCKAGNCRDGVAFFEAALQAGTDDFRTLSAIYR